VNENQLGNPGTMLEHRVERIDASGEKAADPIGWIPGNPGFCRDRHRPQGVVPSMQDFLHPRQVLKEFR